MGQETHSKKGQTQKRNEVEMSLVIVVQNNFSWIVRDSMEVAPRSELGPGSVPHKLGTAPPSAFFLICKSYFLPQLTGLS
jgi:hypothetical protein